MKKITIALILIFFLAGFHPEVKGQYLFKSKVENLPNYDYSPYHFGFLLGLNQMHFTIDPIDNLHEFTFISAQADDVLPTPDDMDVLGLDYLPEFGFTVGILGNLRLGKYFDLRFIPSLAFGERVLNYEIARNYESRPNKQSDTVFMEKRVSSTYLDFPLLLKYKSERYNNFRAYVIGGAQYSLDLASLSNKDEESNNILVKLEKNDVSAIIGFGFEYYLGFFKFGTELKMSYGLSDPLLREGNMYSGSVEQMRSKVFQLSFTFE